MAHIKKILKRGVSLFIISDFIIYFLIIWYNKLNVAKLED